MNAPAGDYTDTPRKLVRDLDYNLKQMHDRIDSVAALLGLYAEFEDVVRSFVLEDNPSLEKQLDAIEECRGEDDPELLLEELATLVDRAAGLIAALREREPA
ncbi:MAG: hypothetical protein JW781_05150 [Deltaproteobacteria bacterium]|nr:hypothetical protein [Candidatus Anaeroferrophillacea bacterium]